MKNALRILISVLSISVAHAATHEVKMLNNGKDGIMVFEPAVLKAKKGDVVNFVPTHPSHDVASVAVPKGAKSWAGKVDKAVKVTLTQEGLYLYECKSHLPMAMIGVIQVGNSANYDEVKKSADALTSKFVLHKDRLDKYLAQVRP